MNLKFRTIILIVIGYSNLVFAFPKIAKNTIAPITEKKAIAPSKDIQLGWTKKWNLSGTSSFNSNNKVIGQSEGDTISIGVNTKYDFTRKSELSEWRNQISFSGATTKTSSIKRYVKSEDEFKYTTSYLKPFEGKPQLGPYVTASVETSLFKGEDIRATDFNYVNQTDSITYSNLDSFQLTDAFRPISTKQAIGLFYKFKEEEKDKIEFRVGIGALQVAAKDQFQVVKADTSNVYIKRLENFSQLGIEYGLSWEKSWSERSKSAVYMDFLTPIGTKVTDSSKECFECSSTRLTNVEIKMEFSNKLNDLVSFSYEYKMAIQPQILNAVQNQHGVKFKIDYEQIWKPSNIEE